MPYATVTPVLDESVRDLCTRPFTRHPKGCPNYGRREICPPAAPLFRVVYDLARPVVAVWNVFDLKAHVAHMRTGHPVWSWRQLVNCRYWQGTARKALRAEIMEAWIHIGCSWTRTVETCPEAMGVDVTNTMWSAGVELEWPPVTRAVQVALLAYPRSS